MEQDIFTLDLRTIWILVRKNILLITGLAVAGAVAFYFYSNYFITPQYQAKMQLAVTTREDAQISITAGELTSAAQLVNTYAVVLTNDSLMEEIIYQLGLRMTKKGLKGSITASPVNQTQIMEMSVRNADPEMAKAILQAITDRANELLTRVVMAGSVEILSPPAAEYTPVSPNTRMNTLIGFAAGMIIALAIVFIRKILTNTFISDEDVTRYLNLPVLGVIPSIKLEERRK